MISDNVLSDRLNLYKNGKFIPEPELISELETLQNIQSPIIKISYEIINLSFIFLKSLAFGLACKSIFIMDWKFLAMLSVGFSIETILSQLFRILRKNK